MARTPTDPTKAQVWITKGLDDLDFEFYFPQGPKGDPGGFVAATSIGATLLDDLKTPGHYRQDNGNNATILNGYPVAAAAGFLEVLQAVTPGDLLQRYTPVAGAATGSGRAIYIRRYFAGIWGAWYAHTSSRIDQTAGRVLYQWDDLNGRDQLIWGDTGTRRVETDFKNGWTAAIASIRRVGSVVSFGVYTMNPAAKTADIAYSIPAGFRPGPYGGNIAFPVKFNSTTDWCQITGAGDVLPPLTASSAVGFVCMHTWITGDAWPTTLPGTASGGISAT
jgi:hypothetical protein